MGISGIAICFVALLTFDAATCTIVAAKDQVSLNGTRSIKAAQDDDAPSAAAESAAANATPLDHVLARYFSNEELGAHLVDYVERCGSISRLQTHGASASGLPLNVLIVGSGAGQTALQAKPAFRYVGNMHGDEPTGRQLLLGLAEWLCARKESDATAARVLERVELQLMPTCNPDGFANHERSNRRGADLNRDFPGVLNLTSKQRIPPPLPAGGTEQPETAAVMAWASSRTFTASAAMHEGALVANYPWDANKPGQTGYAASPDDATFRFLAETYAQKHARMMQDPEFAATRGITNGAQWYEVWGSMQDWVYVDRQCMEITLELSPGKWPPEETLAELFNDNLQALLALPLAAAVAGASGFVQTQHNQPLLANITIAGVSTRVTSSLPFGDFYRPLAPGDYTLMAEAEGFEAEEVAITVPTDGSGVRHNFTLTAAPTGRAPLSQVSSRPGREGSGRQEDSKGASDTHASLSDVLYEGQAVGFDSGHARDGSGVGGRPLPAGAAASAAESSKRPGLRNRKARSDVHQQRGRTLTWQAAAAAGAAVAGWAVHRRRRRRRMWAIRD